MNLRLGSVFFASLLAVIAVSCSRPKTETITISNVEPRRDVNGQIIDAHCGCLQFFNGVFYLYGRAFGTDQDGSTATLPFVVYSSPDLQRWTYVGKVFKDQPRGVYTRPYVVFNPLTKKYVLWYNWFPKLWNGQAGVAVSDTPMGPFVIVHEKAHLIGSCPGDGSLFVDDDGTAYYIYTDMEEGYSLRVEQLTPDFLDTDGKASNVMAKGVEAPILFRRNDIYYVLCGPLCSDCLNGSEVPVFTSRSPLGPFSTKLSLNINRRSGDGATNFSAPNSIVTNRPGEGMPMEPEEGSWYTINPATSNPNIPAQGTWVTKIPAGDDSAYIWIADRWGDTPDGLKGHDSQYWSPLEFAPDGRILPIKYVPEWHITWTLNE